MQGLVELDVLVASSMHLRRKVHHVKRLGRHETWSFLLETTSTNPTAEFFARCSPRLVIWDGLLWVMHDLREVAQL